MNIVMSYLRSFMRRPLILRLRMGIASFRQKYDPIYRMRLRRKRDRQTSANLPYERGDARLWFPAVLGLEETMRLILDRRLSIARFGDGEFDMALGRDMGFERFNAKMSNRLREILAHPIPSCICAIPDAFGSLSAYVDSDAAFWRAQMVRLREELKGLFADEYVSGQLAFGDAQISRPYMRYKDKSIAPRLFDLWKALFANRNLLIVEGRFTRLGIGNDLLSAAKSIHRIWCPPKGAFAHYDEIISAIRQYADKEDLILLSLGATATILAYDLSKEGYWAVDSGHLDIEYLYMLEQSMTYHPIKGRYVNEAGAQGHEEKVIEGEAMANNVVAEIGL